MTAAISAINSRPAAVTEIVTGSSVPMPYSWLATSGDRTTLIARPATTPPIESNSA